MHFGVKGMRWGIRRYQNKDGTLTAAGKARLKREVLEGFRKTSERKTENYEREKKRFYDTKQEYEKSLKTYDYLASVGESYMSAKAGKLKADITLKAIENDYISAGKDYVLISKKNGKLEFDYTESASKKFKELDTKARISRDQDKEILDTQDYLQKTEKLSKKKNGSIPDEIKKYTSKEQIEAEFKKKWADLNKKEAKLLKESNEAAKAYRANKTEENLKRSRELTNKISELELEYDSTDANYSYLLDLYDEYNN